MDPAARAVLVTAVAIVAALSAAGIALAQTGEATGAPRLEVIAPASPLPAKERVNLFLEVVNIGPGSARDLSVFVQPGSSDIIVIGQLVRGLGDLPEGDSDLLVLRVATPGTAGGATLDLRFTFTGPNGETIVRDRSVNIQISPPASDPLEITHVDKPLVAGEPDSMSIVFTNPYDSAITDLDVSLTAQTDQNVLLRASPSISPAGGSSRIVQGGRLDPGRSVAIDVPVLTSLDPKDLLLFTLTARYTLEGFAREQNFDFGVRVIGDVKIRILEAREVATANGLEVVGTIVNVGTGTAWNPRVGVAEGSGLRVEGPVLVEDLEPNDAVDVRIRVERVGPPVEGAPLFTIDWNDDYGNVVEAKAVEGNLRELPPTKASFFDRLGGALGSMPLALWALIALGVLLAAAVAAYLVGSMRWRREEGEGAREGSPGAEGAGEGEVVAEDAADEWETQEKPPWWRRRQKPKGKSGARPGG